jgi:UDP-N-acetylmuramate dehydrogenase
MSREVFEELEAALRGRFAGRVELDRELARLTTYRIGGPAGIFAEPVGLNDLETLGEALRAVEGARGERVPVLALGRGSNLVISDRGFPGLVVRLAPRTFAGIEAQDSGICAGAATSLPLVANWAARRGLSGLEFTIAIPGSVGGGIRMNAGAHGREMVDSLERATLFSLDSSALVERDAAELGLSYRSSTFAERELVVDATFGLRASDPVDIRERMDGYRKHRAATQPPAVQNAGSTFKNPPGDHAGRLVDTAGLKGLRVGGAAVSNLHANFFVTDEGARAQDVYDLVQLVRTRVREGFGVDLEPEVRFVGAFDRHTSAGEGVA